MMYQHLSPDYQKEVLKKWGSVLKAGKPIRSEAAALATALVLENTHREFAKQNRQLNETYTGTVTSLGGLGAQVSTSTQPGGLGSAADFGVNDSRVPTIVIPTLRRIFPELIAHDIVGVQPMNGPAGFAYALRAQYGMNEMGIGGSKVNQGTEIGYNTIDSTFTGTSGLVDLATGSTNNTSNYSATVPGVGTTTQDNAYWQAFAGASQPNANGMGQTLADSEWWKIGEDMPMAQFRIEKGIVEARTRKLAANWSLELAEDMMNMHGVDVDAEMVNIMSYEVQAEIDRQLLGEMVKATIAGGSAHYSDWSPVSADGRNQFERIGTIYTQMLVKSQRIAILTRRGPATFVVASPTVVALLERVSDFVIDAASHSVDANNVGVARVGTLRQGSLQLFRDTFAGGDYVLMGYKGPTAYDSGIIYCPYIPIQLSRAIGQQDFSPRVGVRTRYGILANLFGSANYYHFMRVTGLTASALAADGARVFLY